MRPGVIGKRASEIGIVALIVVSALELGLFFTLRGGANLYSTHERFPVPSGYLLDNRYMAPTAARCYLVRVSSDSCPYCRLDQGQYTRLVQQAQETGCETIILAPVAGEMKLRENSPSMQLQYVDMTLGHALKPLVTPETILLDGRGRPTWQEEGAIDERALEQALHALGRLR